MIETFYSLSFPMVRSKLISKLFSAWNKLVAAFLRMAYPAYCKRHPVTIGVTDEEYDRELVISMTTFPARYDSAVLTLESILRQTMKPNKILLWLTAEENPDRKVPQQFLPYESKGVQICFSDIHLMPHNKSFHTAEMDADRYIITVDDDILYSEKLVERLYTTYRTQPANTIVCELAHRIQLDASGIPKPYDQWDWESKGISGPSHLLMAKGVGGVLYPPGFFRDGYFDINTIRKTCLFADDLWLKFQEILGDFLVVKTKAYAKNVYPTSKSSQRISLASKNNGENRNNVQLKKLIEEFPDIDWKRLK
ncbi:MAG: hypothetical protein ACI3XG_05460 [Faecousia sp.]